MAPLVSLGMILLSYKRGRIWRESAKESGMLPTEGL